MGKQWLPTELFSCPCLYFAERGKGGWIWSWLKNLLLSWPFLLCISGIHYKYCTNIRTTSVLCGFAPAFCKILVYEPTHSLMSCVTSGKAYWWEHYKTLCPFLQNSLYPQKHCSSAFLTTALEKYPDSLCEAVHCSNIMSFFYFNMSVDWTVLWNFTWRLCISLITTLSGYKIEDTGLRKERGWTGALFLIVKS